ncbi:2-hydroxyacid dehydrogenase [Methylobacterium planeticum]|uniref:2-hydroxyacid dehydrogenase n=1 Tax=Methylobacterium planeticum TaxID=2615211 RepID=A0A6N6MGB2_9HYPH|nr:2-hydroxyacid dehydrogenase [Methylobacterium planeticum]KAB1069888.1 2-hydroxyacid dehydrogenase [Methylobacterium planeticum]
MKPDVLLLKAILPDTIQALEECFTVHRLDQAKDRNALLAAVGPVIRAVVVGGQAPAGSELFAQLPALEIIANFGVGYDTIDVASARRHGAIVTNTPDVLTEEVADLALGLLLAVVRRIPQADRYLRAEAWPKAAFPLSASLRERRIGILGLGRIGRAVARRLEGFGSAIAYHGRNRQKDVAYTYHATAIELAQACDVLVVVAPGGGAEALVNAEVLAALGPDGILINVARGSLVDEAALIVALQQGVIHSAGLDVFADEPRVPSALIALDNVVLLPHVGSASHHTRRAMGRLLVDNLVSWFAGRGPVTPVSETPWLPSAG